MPIPKHSNLGVCYTTIIKEDALMKPTILNIFIGFLNYVVSMFGIFVCSLFVLEIEFNSTDAASFVNLAFLLEAIPMALFAYLCLRWFKLKSQEMIIKSVCIWLLVFVSLYGLVGLANGTLMIIFGSPGISLCYSVLY